MAIGRKQNARNEDFVWAWEHIESLVSRAEAEALVKKTVYAIWKVTRGRRVGYAWSGGKDSIALQYVCRRMESVLVSPRDIKIIGVANVHGMG